VKKTLIFLYLILLGCQSQDVPPAYTLFENGTGAYSCYRIPAVIKSPDGSLLAFAEGRTANCGDFGNVDILIRKSTDGGLSWSTEKVLVDNGELQAGNPAPVVDYLDPYYPQGRLFLFYNTGSVGEQELRLGKGNREVHYITSTDNGTSWSSPTNITEQVHFNATNSKTNLDWRTHANTPGHAIQLKKGVYRGRLYIPANHSKGPPQEGYNDYRAYGYYSDDHGLTWKVSPDVPFASSNEAIGVELTDGTLMLNIREQSGNTKLRIVALSSDGGATWDTLYFDPKLISPVCQSSILLFEDEKTPLLIYSGPNSTDKREKMTLKISMDNGKNWEYEKEVYSGGAAYSDLVQIDNKRIGLFYEKEFEKLVFEIFTPKAVLSE